MGYELDRFIEAMKVIRKEIMDVEDGKIKSDESPLRHAPHTADVVTKTAWQRAYTRTKGCYPVKSLMENKYWPTVSRIDDVIGDQKKIAKKFSVNYNFSRVLTFPPS